MKELVVISGKGGTGKTSMVASFAALACNAVLADCDVDAADLHLVMAPSIVRTEDFSGGSLARVLPEACTGCGKCAEICRFDAVSQVTDSSESGKTVYRIDPVGCEGCGVCAHFCPADAIDFSPAINGQWFLSDTRRGPMVHARLGVAEENSGKLVSLVRQEAKKVAEQRKLELILVDGSPGIGCPVIASIGGADLVLVVTEPTLSGLHDLKRVSDLTRFFNVPTLVAINKWDLNGEMTAEIEAEADKRDLAVVGRVRYDRVVTEAQIAGQAVVEMSDEGAGADIREVWASVRERIES